MKYIYFFIPNGTGGAEKASLNYAKILHESGFRVKIFIISKPNDNYNKITRFINNDICYEFIKSSKGYTAFFKIFKVLYKKKPEYVFSSFTIISAILIIQSFFISKFKVIARQCFMPGTENKIIEMIISILFRFAYINIAQTDEMKSAMIKKYRIKSDKIISINNPIDEEDIISKTSSIIPISHQNTYNYVSIGRIHKQKDYLTLLIAFKEIKKIKSQATLTIIGQKKQSDQYYLSLIDYIRKERLEENIKFVDYTDNPYIYISNSDCFVLSSITEGLPNVIIEAMFLNIPIVATRSIPFIEQNVLNGINGYNVSIQNPKELANAMLIAPELKGKINNPNHNSTIKKQIIKIFS